MRTARWLLLLALVSPARAGEGTEATAPPDSAESGTSVDLRVEQARSAFLEGTALSRAGDWLNALAAFERSHELRPHPVTSYNQAFCARSLGRVASARGLLLRARREHESKAIGILPQELQTALAFYLAELTERAARVRLRLTEPAEVSVDGHPIVGDPTRSVAEGHAFSISETEDGNPVLLQPGLLEVLVDRGTHVFRVLPQHGEPQIITRAVEDRMLLELPIAPRQAPISVLPPPPVRTDAAVSQLEPLPQTAAPSPALRTATWVSLSLAGAAVVTGSVAGIYALEKDAELNEACVPQGQCSPTHEDDIRALNTSATISTVSFVVAGVAAATGVVLWLLPGKKAQEKARLVPRGRSLELRF